MRRGHGQRPDPRQGVDGERWAASPPGRGPDPGSDRLQPGQAGAAWGAPWRGGLGAEPTGSFAPLPAWGSAGGWGAPNTHGCESRTGTAGRGAGDDLSSRSHLCPMQQSSRGRGGHSPEPWGAPASSAAPKAWGCLAGDGQLPSPAPRASVLNLTATGWRRDIWVRGRARRNGDRGGTCNNTQGCTWERRKRRRRKRRKRKQWAPWPI